MPNDSTGLQHHVVAAAIHLAFQDLDVARVILPHECQQPPQEDVPKRLLAQA